jgi:hypothetical protein
MKKRMTLLGLMTVLIGWWMFGPEEHQGAVAARGAQRKLAAETDKVIADCQGQILRSLRTPKTASFVREQTELAKRPDGWDARFRVDAQNGFGAMLRGSWYCEVRGGRITVKQEGR